MRELVGHPGSASEQSLLVIAAVLEKDAAAGLKNFDVEYRVDSGTWSLIRSGTTATSIAIGSRAHRHYYSLRVRSRDWRGNVSYWTSPITVWLP